MRLLVVLTPIFGYISLSRYYLYYHNPITIAIAIKIEINIIVTILSVQDHPLDIPRLIELLLDRLIYHSQSQS